MFNISWIVRNRIKGADDETLDLRKVGERRQKSAFQAAIKIVPSKYIARRILNQDALAGVIGDLIFINAVTECRERRIRLDSDRGAGTLAPSEGDERSGHTQASSTVI